MPKFGAIRPKDWEKKRKPKVFPSGTKEFVGKVEGEEPVDKQIQRFENVGKTGYDPKSGEWGEHKPPEDRDPREPGDIAYGTKAKYPGEKIGEPEAKKRQIGHRRMVETELEKEPAIGDLPEGAKKQMASLAYNVGTRAVKGSKMMEALKEGDIETAHEEGFGVRGFKFAKVKGKAKVMPGLEKRREEEGKKFLASFSTKK